jgi:hypothetical protein
VRREVTLYPEMPLERRQDHLEARSLGSRSLGSRSLRPGSFGSRHLTGAVVAHEHHRIQQACSLSGGCSYAG